MKQASESKHGAAYKGVELAEAVERIQNLRKRSGMSIRQLASASGVTAGMISFIERGTSSPSLVTLQKILSALGTDLAELLSSGADQNDEHVFYREKMKTISDEERTYSMVLPKRESIAIEMLDEHLRPVKKKPQFETLNCDIAGYVLDGTMTLEIKGQKKQALRTGDSFYVNAGIQHRGYATGDGVVRLITVTHPPKY